MMRIAKNIRWIGRGVSLATFGIFSYVGAAANVFCQNQLRLARYVSDWFKTEGVARTAEHFAFWFSIPAVLQGLRKWSKKDREALVAELNRRGEARLTDTEVYEMSQRFGSSWAHLTDSLSAVGEGVKMANVFPILVTLMNVYANDLTQEDGSIADDRVYAGYVTAFLTSGILFGAKEYDANRDDSGQLAKQFLSQVRRHLPEAEPGVMKEVPQTKAAQFAGLFRQRYDDFGGDDMSRDQALQMVGEWNGEPEQIGLLGGAARNV